ncbi:hypothetical protein ACHAWF_016083 [Thalassiosira exigua]
MKQFILDADSKLTKNGKVPTPDISSKERLFLHWEYHPDDIPQKQIRAIYNETLKDTLADTLGIK